MSFQNTKNNLEYNHPIRSPSEVMKLDRLGSFHQTRLSFTRRLIDDLKYQKSKIEIHQWNIDNNGIGSCLLYTSPSPRDGLLSRMPSSA